MLRCDGPGAYDEDLTEAQYDQAFEHVAALVSREARDRSVGAANLFAKLQDLGKLEEKPSKLSDVSLDVLCKALEDLRTEAA